VVETLIEQISIYFVM